MKLGGRWRRKSWKGLALVLSASLIIGSLFTAVTATRKGHHGRITVSCVSRETGDVRIVRRAGDCVAGEYLKRWNVRSRRGRQGPAGPTGASTGVRDLRVLPALRATPVLKGLLERMGRSAPRARKVPRVIRARKACRLG